MSDYEKYLFRGKRKDNGDWVYGYYCVFNRMIHCIYTGYAETDCGSIYPVYYEVDPDTVGQYTVVNDRNGKEIFDGDIVEFYFFEKTKRKDKIVEVKNAKTMRIKRKDSVFCMEELYRNYRLDAGLNVITEIIYDYRGNTATGVYKSNSCYFVEIIGNIHDNSELLKKE